MKINAIAKILTVSIISLTCAAGITPTATAQITVDREAKAPVKREAPTDPLTIALCKQYWGTAAKLVEQQIAALPAQPTAKRLCPRTQVLSGTSDGVRIWRN
jgi:hypothetical protein